MYLYTQQVTCRRPIVAYIMLLLCILETKPIGVRHRSTESHHGRLLAEKRLGKITAHMRANGFELQNRFVVQQRDTFDLVYVPKRDFVEALPQGGNVRPASTPFGRPATRSTSARRSYSYA